MSDGLFAFVTPEGMCVFVERQTDQSWRAVTMPYDRPKGWHGPIQSVSRSTMAQAAVALGVRHDTAVATAIHLRGTHV